MHHLRISRTKEGKVETVRYASDLGHWNHLITEHFYHRGRRCDDDTRPPIAEPLYREVSAPPQSSRKLIDGIRVMPAQYQANRKARDSDGSNQTRLVVVRVHDMDPRLLHETPEPHCALRIPYAPAATKLNEPQATGIGVEATPGEQRRRRDVETSRITVQHDVVDEVVPIDDVREIEDPDPGYVSPSCFVGSTARFWPQPRIPRW